MHKTKKKKTKHFEHVNGTAEKKGNAHKKKKKQTDEKKNRLVDKVFFFV